MQKLIVVIAGPTAIGKTALSIDVAEHYQTEIVSADSRQFYKELSIGTAKPNNNELNRVKHHFIDSISIKQDYTAAQFEKDALVAIEKLFDHHNIVVLTGGSGLYIDALCNGLNDAPPADEKIRKVLQRVYESEGIEKLQEMLIELDPEFAKKVDMNNPHRIIRALEINMVSGKNMHFFQQSAPQKRPFNILKICLTTARETLYQRINERVDAMIAAGLEDEALAYYHLKNINALQTVGYSEFFDFFEGKYNFNETVEKIKQHTRNYAKRQLTWFRRDKAYHWFDIPVNNQTLFTFIDKTANQTA